MYNVKKYMNYKAIVRVLLGLVVVFFVHSYQASAAGLGLSPVTLGLSGILPNTEVVKIFYLSRSNTSSAERAYVTFSGPAKDNFSGAEYVDMPVGQAITPYPITIKPGNASEGTYTATILFSKKPLSAANEDRSTKKVGGATVRVEVGAQAKVSFDVTNNASEEYTVSDVKMDDVEEQQPIGFSFVVHNTGNTDVRPTKIMFAVEDASDPTSSYKETFTAEQVQAVQPFSNAPVTVLTKAELPVGTYQATVSFYDAKGMIFTDDSTRFQVLPAGSTAQSGELESYDVGKSRYASKELVKVTGAFKNTGTTGLSVKFVTEFFKGGTRVDVVKNDPIYVPMGQVADMDMTYRPPQDGSYTAHGYTTFGIHKSNEKTSNFTVSAVSPWLLWVFLAVVTLLILLGIRWSRTHHVRFRVSPADTKRGDE